MGPQVENGKKYSFEAPGIWTDWFIDCSADGYETPRRMKMAEKYRRMPDEQFFALICCVEEEMDSCLLIGEGKDEVSFSKSGALTCFANDLWYFYWNNKGSLEVDMKEV